MIVCQIKRQFKLATSIVPWTCQSRCQQDYPSRKVLIIIEKFGQRALPCQSHGPSDLLKPECRPSERPALRTSCYSQRKLAGLMGSARVRRYPHRHDCSASKCGFSRGPRAYWVRVPSHAKGDFSMSRSHAVVSTIFLNSLKNSGWRLSRYLATFVLSTSLAK